MARGDQAMVNAIIAFVLSKTPFDRYMYAVGNNPTAAKILGIRVNQVRVIVFVCADALSALVGIPMVARMGTAQPSIAASVIGGVSTTGGVGGPIGAILGAAIVNIIIPVGIDTYRQSGVSNAVVVIAISVDALSRRFFRKDA